MSNIKKDIIYPAWKLINEDTKLKKAFFFSGLFSVLFASIILTYQAIYTYVVFYNQEQEAINKVKDFFESWYFVETIIILFILFIIYETIIPIFEWWFIKYVDLKRKWKDISIWDLIGFWIHNFLKIFEFTNLTGQLKFLTILNIYLFLIRWFDWQFIKAISIFILIYLFIATIFNILFIYAKYEIVLEKKWVIAAITKSREITIVNFITTIKLYFFMFALNIRVLINFVIVLFFPILISVSLTSISSIYLKYLSIFFIVIIFSWVILILSYLSWVLEIFKNTIWYNAYIEGKKKVDFIKE